MTQPRIMIVEDDFLIRLTLSESLADEGFDIVEASSGEEALAMVQDGADVALVLTDIQLGPAMDGNELARRLRVSFPDLPMIFMTGRPDSVAQLSGPSRSIAKPYLPSEVCTLVRQMLAD